MYSNAEVLKNEIRDLKSENGKLKQKVNVLEYNNNDLRKLIETMSDSPNVTISAHAEENAPRFPGHVEPVGDVPVPSIHTSNLFAALASVAPHGQPPSSGQAPPRTGVSEPSQQPTSVTVVGSSIVRGVAPLVHSDSFNATGFVYPGQTARQINARIRGIPSSDVTVLAAGTNNIEHQTIDQCKNEISQIIDNVARKRDKKVVIMGQIPKRLDKPHLNSKIDSVNRHISDEISKRKRWYFMNIDLKTSDYKKDGLHLNEIGTAKYALEIRHMIRSLKRVGRHNK